MKQFSIFFAFILLMALGVVLNEALECKNEYKENINGVKKEDKEVQETCGQFVTKCFKFKCEAGANTMKAKGCGSCGDFYFELAKQGKSKFELDDLGCKCEEESAKNPEKPKPNPDNAKPKQKAKTSDSESDNGSFGCMISIMAIGIGVFASFMLVILH